MQSRAYILGFMDKLAESSEPVDNKAIAKALRENFRKDDDKNGVLRRKDYVQPTTTGEHIAYIKDRILTHLSSLGRGTASALGVAGLRFGQSALDMATWIPALADDVLFGMIAGVDEGRGLTGRLRGKFNRAVDKSVHAVRKWSDDYDYVNRVGGGFNRLLNGLPADALGTIAGFGGIGGLVNIGKKRLLSALVPGAFGSLHALIGSPAELRKREAWIHSLKPEDRLRIDPTSTATNQMQAPTLEEYIRYHMPSGDESTSASGYIRIPYHWRHTRGGKPVQFRDFGT